MNERDQLLEEIKQEIHSAADELKADQTNACCHRLVAALFLLTQLLDEQYVE